MLAEQKIDAVMGRAAHMSKRSREAASLRMRLCRRRKTASSPHEQKEPRSGEFANALCRRRKTASSPHEQKEPRSGEFANEALQEKKDGEQPT